MNLKYLIDNLNNYKLSKDILLHSSMNEAKAGLCV